MKKLLTILFISISFAAQSQVLQEPTIYGTLYRNLGAKEGLLIPMVCGVPTLPAPLKKYGQSAIAADTCNNKFYFYNPKDSSWSEAGISQSTIDSILGGYYSIGQVDSIVTVLRSEIPDISGKVNYTDSGSVYVTPTALSLHHDSAAYHTSSLNSDSTQLSLIRPNGTKDTIEVWADGFVPGGGGGAYVPPYKVYTALLTVSDSAGVPTAVVLENTLGVTVTYSRLGVGWYNANLSSPLNGDKLVFICRNEAFTTPSLFDGVYIDGSTIGLYVRGVDGTPNDNALYRAFFEIRVYN